MVMEIKCQMDTVLPDIIVKVEQHQMHPTQATRSIWKMVHARLDIIVLKELLFQLLVPEELTEIQRVHHLVPSVTDVVLGTTVKIMD